MSKSSKPTRAANPNAEPSPHAFHAAFTKTAAARAALAADELTTINLDVQLALTTVLGTLPRLATFHDAIASSLPEHDLGEFDKLAMYAEALAHAQGAYLAASEPAEPLPALLARAAEVRDQLVTDATALAKRGYVDGKRLAELNGGTGYLNTSSDLNVLVRMLRERWSDIAAKSAIEAAEVDEAERLYERITLAYAQRTQPSATAAAASDDRQRAFTLLVRAYDQARRAIAYLRWTEGDADTIAPSLWAGRGGRHAGVAAAAGGGVDGGGTGRDPGTPAAPEPANGAGVPAAPGTVVPGHPGGSPFVS